MSFSIKAEAAVVKEKNFFLCERLINMVVLCIMKTGLVLEGGGMRGMYTAGVIDILMENNVSVNIIIGVSAGAAFGCNFKSKQIGRVIRYNAAYCKNPHYAGFRSLLFTGDFYGQNSAMTIFQTNLIHLIQILLINLTKSFMLYVPMFSREKRSIINVKQEVRKIFNG